MSLLKYWSYIFILNIGLFNFLYLGKARYGDVLGFAFIASLMYSIPSFIICMIIFAIAKYFDIKFFKSLLLNLIIGVSIYIVVIETLDQPFLLDLFRNNLTSMETFVFTSALVSIILSITIVWIYKAYKFRK